MPERVPMWRRYLRFFGADPKADLDDELEFHVEERTDELIARGVPAEEARCQAVERLGDLQAIKRNVWAADRSGWRRERIRDVTREVRHALRRLRREPAFSAMALATLTLGIGAAVGVFAVVNGIVLAPLPYPEPDRLVQLSPGQNFNMAMADQVGEAEALEASSGVSGWSLTLTGNGDPAVLHVQAVDAEFFDVMGVRPMVGRPFGPEERDPGLSDVVILSYGIWQARFGGDPDVIERRLDLDGSGHATRRVIGVMPPEFEAPSFGRAREIVAWIPLSRAPGRTVATDSTWYVNNVIARLAPSATVEQAAQQVRLITSRLHNEFPNVVDESSVNQAGAIGLLESIVGDVRGSLFALLGAVGLVLLLACANLANLLLARGGRRRRELAVRAALGAGRGRLVREQLTDSIVLAMTGGALGIALAKGLIALLDLGRASGLPRAQALEIDWRVLGFALLVSLVSAIAFGLWPALRASAGDVRDDLAASSRSPGQPRGAGRFGAVLVAGELAMATVLVTGAGLLLASLSVLRSTESGIDPADVVAMELAPPPAKYEGASAQILYDQLLERLGALPGVRAAGAIHLLPFTANNWSFPYLGEGQTPPDGPLPSANFRVVAGDYFEAVDQPLVEGRLWTDAEARESRLRVGVVNQAMARLIWPEESAVGKTVRVFGSMPFEVVGVVGDVRQFSLDRAPRPEMYVPHGAWRLASLVVMLEVTGDPRAVMAAARSAVWDVDRDIPVVQLRELSGVLGDSMDRHRFFASVLTFFGVLALVLGAVGVFGVMAYSMGARRTEFGIRMALGATRSRVLGRALARAAVPIAIGLAGGLVASGALSRVIASLLYGVEPGDPTTLASAALVLAAVGVLATFVPAYRATQVDPGVVMRTE